jgi:hypothetical protein
MAQLEVTDTSGRMGRNGIHENSVQPLSGGQSADYEEAQR